MLSVPREYDQDKTPRIPIFVKNTYALVRKQNPVYTAYTMFEIQRSTQAEIVPHRDEREARKGTLTVCPICKSGNTQPYSSIYGFGTTNINTKHGLIFRRGFRWTTRQSVMASKCAPPSKMSWIPAILFASLAFVAAHITSSNYRFLAAVHEFGYWSIVGAIAFAAVGAAYNTIAYPRRMEKWGSKFLCRRCGTTFDV